MKKTTFSLSLVFLIISLFSLKTYAITPGGEILRAQLSKETHDTNKIKIIIRYVMLHPTVSDRYLWFNEAQKLSLKNNYRAGLIYHRCLEGLHLADSGKIDAAIGKFRNCIDGLDSLGIVEPTSYPLNSIQELYDIAGKQFEKFQYYTEKLRFYQKHGPMENTANCFHGIADYYLYLADYDKAIEYYLRAREVYRKFDSIGVENETGLIGNAYLQWGNLTKAEEYLKQGLNESAHLGFRGNVIYCNNYLAELYLKKHNYNRSIECCFNLRKQIQNMSPEYKAINYVHIAAVHLLQEALQGAFFYLQAAEMIRQQEKLTLIAPYGNLELDYYYYLYYVSKGDQTQALTSLELALQEARDVKFMPLILKYTDELHSYHLGRGDSLQSLRYLQQYYTIQDTLNKWNMQARIATYEIEQVEHMQQNQIELLQIQKATQRKYYLFGGLILILVVLGTISRYTYKRKLDNELLTAEFQRQLAEAEIKALRAQMNPHFIFNCLNSINSLVIEQKHEIASDYLIKFSKLIRLILDNSRCEKISIEKELETLKLYLVLESARFDNKFSCIIHISEDVDVDLIMIPPMLLQPFVENAIWHGLMQKETEGIITLEIRREHEDFLGISITDDGIGREKAAELKSKTLTHKPHGLKVTTQRIEMMNKMNSTGAHVEIIDLHDAHGNSSGTKVKLVIPI